MRLTWKDAVTTLAAGLNTLVFVLYLQGTDLPIIGSTRGAAAAILLLGVFGGCALGSAMDAIPMDRTAGERSYVLVASLFGVTALVAGAAALIGDGVGALGVLYYATIALWFIATLRHILSSPEPSPLTRDTHEVIDHDRTIHG
jgi:hypothetical protein